MKRINLWYRITTALFAVIMLGSALPDLFVAEVAVKGFGEIGLPASLVPFLGAAKLLGVFAILVPGSFPRIREWAYAGLLFDLIGGCYLIAASGKAPLQWLPMLLFIALGFASYALFHKRKALRARARQAGHAASLFPASALA
jgi:hypothetical protein